jgi:CBS domain-containing protein
MLAIVAYGRIHVRAYDVMTWGVKSVEADAPITRAAQLMLENEIGALLVVDANGRLTGIVTEGDLIKRCGELSARAQLPQWLRLVCADGQPSGESRYACDRKVGQITTPAPITVSGEARLEEVIRLFNQYQIKRLPVVDYQELLGIVSRRDLLRALVKLGYEAKAARSRGAAIRQQVLPEHDRRFRDYQVY